MHLPPGNHKEKEYQERIRKSLSFIQENLSSEITLSDMAEAASFSPFHFQRLFTRLVGETPKKYVLRLRLEKLAHKLKLFPELTVNELSFQAGFSSPSAFGRAFKKYYGVSPDEFRKLSPSEISKICTSVNKNGIDFILKPEDLWTENYNEAFPIIKSGPGKMVVIKQRSLKVAFIDTHLGAEDAISNAFKALYSRANPRDLVNESTRFFGIYLDLPFFTELSKCRFRACLSLPANIEIPKGIETYIIPEDRYAVFTAKGKLDEVLKALVVFRHEMLENSGFQIAETIGYEEYPVNPALEDYIPLERKIHVPVKPA